VSRRRKLQVKRFASALDFLDSVKKTPYSTKYNTGKNEVNTDFYILTRDEALELGASGWAEGTKKLEEARQKISAPLFSQLESEVKFDVAPGEWVDVGRLLTGEAEVWGYIGSTENLSASAKGKYATIAVNVGARASVDDHQFVNRGAAIAAAVDVLEHLGFRVRVEVYSQVDSRGNGGDDEGELEVSFTLKNHEDPLDVDAIAFWTAHVGSYRRLTFAAREQDPDVEFVNRLAAGGGGASLQHAEPTFEHDIATEGMNGGNQHRYDTPEKAAEETKRILEHFGVLLEGMEVEK
jgi:hypothetical protein